MTTAQPLPTATVRARFRAAGPRIADLPTSRTCTVEEVVYLCRCWTCAATITASGRAWTVDQRGKIEERAVDATRDAEIVLDERDLEPIAELADASARRGEAVRAIARVLYAPEVYVAADNEDVLARWPQRAAAPAPAPAACPNCHSDCALWIVDGRPCGSAS